MILKVLESVIVTITAVASIFLVTIFSVVKLNALSFIPAYKALFSNLFGFTDVWINKWLAFEFLFLLPMVCIVAIFLFVKALKSTGATRGLCNSKLLLLVILSFVPLFSLLNL
jgi:hypothetical protein